ncbi:MAG: carboxypeptidase regulatory-like domain-containing protein, partial [Candidatus Zixiibacteriota bacterium]
YNSARTQVGTSGTSNNVETISLNGKPEGWYYVRVFGFSGATNPYYKLTINPPANGTPAVVVVDPPAGDSMMVHGVNTYKVEWNYSDPETDECWVSVYFNSAPVLNGNQQILPTSLNTQATQGFHVINSAYVPADTSLYVYCQITDGGTTTGSWSAGTVTFVHQDHAQGSIAGAVINSDSLPIPNAVVYLNSHEHEDTTIASGLFLMAEVEPGFYALTVEHPGYRDSTLTNVMVNVGGMKDQVIMLAGCGFVAGDGDGSSEVTISDAVYLINYIFAGGGEPSPSGAGDANCDGMVNISDAAYLINFIFVGGLPPCSGC